MNCFDSYMLSFFFNFLNFYYQIIKYKYKSRENRVMRLPYHPVLTIINRDVDRSFYSNSLLHADAFEANSRQHIDSSANFSLCTSIQYSFLKSITIISLSFLRGKSTIITYYEISSQCLHFSNFFIILL